MNEAVYKNPKWLSKYLDFELRTGKDKKNHQKKIDDWNYVFNKIDKVSFEKFYEETFNNTFYIRRFNKKYEGDFDILKKYNEWLDKRLREEKEKIEKEKKYERLKNELNFIIDEVIKDFKGNPYKDKISYYNYIYVYMFENNDNITFDFKKLIYDNKKYKKTYTLNYFFISSFTTLFDEIYKRANKERYYKYNYTKDNYTKEKDPKRIKYDKLLATIKLRKEQLDKIPKNDPNRMQLENELENTIKLVNDMKIKYKFENLNHLKSWSGI